MHRYLGLMFLFAAIKTITNIDRPCSWPGVCLHLAVTFASLPFVRRPLT